MQNEQRTTALFAACTQGHYDPTVLLIEHGADVNYLSEVRPLYVHGQHGRMVCSVWSKVELLYMVIIVNGSLMHVEIVGSINFRAT